MHLLRPLTRYLTVSELTFLPNDEDNIVGLEGGMSQAELAVLYRLSQVVLWFLCHNDPFPGNYYSISFALVVRVKLQVSSALVDTGDSFQFVLKCVRTLKEISDLFANSAFPEFRKLPD